MEPIEIAQLLDTAGASLARATRRYWPTKGSREIAEANQVIHVAGVLTHAGWHCWAEATWGDGTQTTATNPRLDLLAWHEPSCTLLAVEAKRLYSREKLAGMVSDVERITSFNLLDQTDMDVPIVPRQRYGAVIATTWQREIAGWWRSAPGATWAGGAEWDRRKSAVRAAGDGLWGSVPLGTEATDGTIDGHHFLHAVWRLG